MTRNDLPLSTDDLGRDAALLRGCTGCAERTTARRGEKCWRCGRPLPFLALPQHPEPEPTPEQIEQLLVEFEARERELEKLICPERRVNWRPGSPERAAYRRMVAAGYALRRAAPVLARNLRAAQTRLATLEGESTPSAYPYLVTDAQLSDLMEAITLLASACEEPQAQQARELVRGVVQAARKVGG